MKRLEIWILSLTLLASPAFAMKKEAPMSDAQILALLHEDNTAEIQRGQMARMQVVSEDVKHYAMRLEKDDRKADRYVRALAGRLGVKLQKEDPVTKNDVVLPISEQAFVQAAVEEHEELLDTLNHQCKLLPKDSPMYDLIVYLMPTIRSHYDAASSLETKLAQSNTTEQLASSFVLSNPN
jgi:predicted outer membrane protein